MREEGAKVSGRKRRILEDLNDVDMTMREEGAKVSGRKRRILEDLNDVDMTMIIQQMNKIAEKKFLGNQLSNTFSLKDFIHEFMNKYNIFQSI